MWYGTAGCIVALTLRLLAVPLLATAQPRGTIPRIAYLTLAPGPWGCLVDTSRASPEDIELIAPRAVPGASYPVAGRLERSALEQTAVYFPYFAIETAFDDSCARARLDPAGVRVSPLPEYLARRAELGWRAVTSALLRAAGLAELFVDTGLDGLSLAEFGELAGAPVRDDGRMVSRCLVPFRTSSADLSA